MGLRPGRTVRRLERPYTRVSKRVPRKSYVAGAPESRVHHFEMGTPGEYDLTLYLTAKREGQIRDNALESARVTGLKFLDKKIGKNFFFKILLFPHHVLREKPIATGAGADRYSQGMRLAFGKPAGRAVQVFPGKRIMSLMLNKEHLEIGKIALKKAGSKLSVPTRIEIEE